MIWMGLYGLRAVCGFRGCRAVGFVVLGCVSIVRTFGCEGLGAKPRLTLGVKTPSPNHACCFDFGISLLAALAVFFFNSGV